MAATNTKTVSERTGWKTAIAGLASNVSTLMFHPLENIKVRLQANDGMRNNHLPHYNGLMNAITTMYKNEGFVSFFRGVWVNMLGNCSANFIFFYVYAREKRIHDYHRDTAPLYLTAYISL